MGEQVEEKTAAVSASARNRRRIFRAFEFPWWPGLIIEDALADVAGLDERTQEVRGPDQSGRAPSITAGEVGGAGLQDSRVNRIRP